MKIRLFEEYTKPTSDYYTIITRDDYIAAEEQRHDEQNQSTEVELTLRERDLLLAYLNDWGYAEDEYLKNARYLVAISDRAACDNSIAFFKTVDEYYYILLWEAGTSYGQTFYRCDQWNGLVRWFQDYAKQLDLSDEN